MSRDRKEILKYALSAADNGAVGEIASDQRMAPTHRLIRVVLVVATVGVGVTYLLWRAIATLAGVPPGLAIAALSVEVAGVLASSALLVALRRPPTAGPSSPPLAAGDVPGSPSADRPWAFAVTPPAGTPVTRADELPTEQLTVTGIDEGTIDVIVRFDAQPIGHLHATLAGVRFMYGVRSITVVSSVQFDAARATLSSTKVAVVQADRRDAASFDAALRHGTAPLVAFFDAGDVPLPGFTGAVGAHFAGSAGSAVAAVQTLLATNAVDSSEHDPRGRHELTFERESLNPSLGAKGSAVVSGSGAVLRRAALEDLAGTKGARSRRSRRTVELMWSIRARARGHRVLAPTQALVAAAPVNSERAVLSERRRATAAAIGVLVSAQSPLWRFRLRLSQRVGYLAWMVRPLAGLRRAAFVAVLGSSFAIGDAPFEATWIGMVGLWLPWVVLQSVTLDRFSGGTLRPGDRARWSLRTMGPALAGLAGAGAGRFGAGIASGRRGGPGNALKNRVLVLGLVVMAATTIAAAMDRWRPVLPAMPVVARAALLAVCLWVIAAILDVMRCLIGGPLLRGSTRVGGALPAVVDGRSARIVDLSPLGVGIQIDDGVPTVNDVLDVVFDVPSVGGQPARVEARALVRNVRPGRDATVCGLEFGAMSRSSADALHEYCVVLHRPSAPADLPGAPAERHPSVAVGAVSQQRRAGIRLVGVASLAGVLVATVPPYGSSSTVVARAADTIDVFVFDDLNGDGRFTEGASEGSAGGAGAPITETGVAGLEVVATCVVSSDLVSRRAGAISAADDARTGMRQQTERALAEASRRRDEIDARKANGGSRQAGFQDRITTAAAAHVAAAHAAEVAEMRTWTPVDGGDGSGAGTVVDAAEPRAIVVVEAPAVAATDEGDGTYRFVGLPGSPCRVEVRSLPTGLRAAPSGPDNDGLVQFVDGGGEASMAVTSAEPVDGAAVEVATTVWLDADGDGVRNALEPGLPGITVTLEVSGTVMAVDTDADGKARFTSTLVPALLAGATARLSVPVSLPVTDHRVRPLRLGTVSAPADADAEAEPAPAFGVTGAVELVIAAGVSEHRLGAPYRDTFELSDLVWDDSDGDGVLGAGEAGLDDVVALLFTDTDGDDRPDGAPIDADRTSGGGRFRFTALPPGRYLVEVVPPAGYASSTGVVGNSHGPFEPVEGPVVPVEVPVGTFDHGVQLASGSVRSPGVEIGADGDAGVGGASMSFGIFRVLAIADTVWLDDDRDGVLTEGESGLPGVPIVLRRGDETVTLTITDADGDFEFGHLVAGEYLADVFLPAGLEKARFVVRQDDGETGDPPLDEPNGTVDPAATIPLDDDPDLNAGPATGDPGNLPPTADPGPTDPGEQRIESVPVAVRAGEAITGGAVVAIPSEPALFGLQRSTSIGRRVWSDLDDDGVIDPDEPGVPGAVVRLVSGGKIVERVITAADGTYRFDDPVPGTYLVDVVLPVGARTSSVSWAEQKTAAKGIDNGGGQQVVGKAVTAPITLGRSPASDITAGTIANVGVFVPAPAATIEAAVNGCAADERTGPNGPFGGCTTLDQSAENPVVAVGATTTLTAVVRNTGNVPLSNARVEGVAALDCNGTIDGDGVPFLLEVGDVVTCSTRQVVVAGQSSETLTLTTEAERTPGARGALDPVTDGVAWFGTAAGLEVRAFAVTESPGPDADADGVLDAATDTGAFTIVDEAPIAGGADRTANHLVGAGEQVWWLYRVTNRTATTLESVAVTVAGRGPLCGDLTLAPGETVSCVAEERAARDGDAADGQVRRTGTATAIDAGVPGVPVSVGPASASTHVFVPEPALSLAVVLDGVEASSGVLQRPAGAVLPITYLVTNIGDLAFASVLLSDDAVGVVDCPELTVGVRGLQPGETVRCTASTLVPVLAEGGVRQIVVTAEGTPASLLPVAPPVDGSEPAPAPPDPVPGTAGTLPMVAVEITAVVDPVTARVADRAWIDTDADGTFDDGEPPAAGVPITLLGTAGPVATTSTDQAGRFEFIDLPPGVYAVEAQLPFGLISARALADRGVVLGGRVVTDPVLLDGINDDPDWALPLAATTEAAGTVWTDANGDGVRAGGDADPPDSGRADVTVVLVDGRGVAVDATVTDDSGGYRFDSLPPSGRGVRVTVTRPARAGAGGGVVTPSGSVSGAVWDDIDGDGKRPDAPSLAVGGASSLERPAPGVIITLVDGRGAVVALTTTDAEGRFAFTGLAAGRVAAVLGPPTVDVAPALLAASLVDVAADQQVELAEQMVSPERRTELVPDARPTGSGDPESADDSAGLPAWVPSGTGEIVTLLVFLAALVLTIVVLASPRRRRVVD